MHPSFLSPVHLDYNYLFFRILFFKYFTICSTHDIGTFYMEMQVEVFFILRHLFTPLNRHIEVSPQYKSQQTKQMDLIIDGGFVNKSTEFTRGDA